MSEFLLLVGLALFISGGAMYFVHAYQHDSRWVVSSVLFPFVVPLYYRRNWDDLQVAALVQSAGLAMTVSGALMLTFQSDRPEGLVSQRDSALTAGVKESYSGFVDSERALKLLIRHGPGTPLSGRLNGEDFTPDRVELIDNTLRLIKGRPYWPEREIEVVFPEGSIDLSQKTKRAVGPDTVDAPVMRVTWLDERGQPVTEVFDGGYRLEIEAVPATDNKLSGFIQLMLPDRLESFVGGDVTVLTNHLRYVGGEVDLRFDHEDTLRYVAASYVRTQYSAPDIAGVSFADVQMDTLAGSGRLLATVALKDGREGRHVVVLGKSDSGWYALGPESMAATGAAGFKPVYALVVSETEAARVVEERTRSAPVARKGNERTMAFADLDSLSGQGAIVAYRSGRSEQGVLRGLRRERLVVEAIKGGGTVEYLVPADELAQLKLNNGDIVRIEGAAPVAVVTQSSAPSAAPAGNPAAAALMVGDHDISVYMNRSVTVVSSSGKTTTGVLRGLGKEGLVVETQVGAGKLDYIVPLDQFQSIDFAK